MAQALAVMLSSATTDTDVAACVTGQPVFGSLNDYYLEQSFGKLRVEGKAFNFVKVSKDRMKYAVGSKSALFDEAVSLLLQRDGKDALDNFDGIFFLYAGARAKVEKGGIYWPHRSSFSYKGKRWPYFICPEGGDKMDLTVASFDDPSSFVPKHHFGAESIHRAWLSTEGLPEQRSEDYQPLVDKWVDATGKFPG